MEHPEPTEKAIAEIDWEVKTAAVWATDPEKILGVVMNASREQFNPQVVRERISKEIARRNSMHLFDLAREDIQTIEDKRILDALCEDVPQRPDGDGRGG